MGSTEPFRLWGGGYWSYDSISIKMRLVETTSASSESHTISSRATS